MENWHRNGLILYAPARRRHMSCISVYCTILSAAGTRLATFQVFEVPTILGFLEVFSGFLEVEKPSTKNGTTRRAILSSAWVSIRGQKPRIVDFRRETHYIRFPCKNPRLKKSRLWNPNPKHTTGHWPMGLQGGATIARSWLRVPRAPARGAAPPRAPVSDVRVTPGPSRRRHGCAAAAAGAGVCGGGRLGGTRQSYMI